MTVDEDIAEQFDEMGAGTEGLEIEDQDAVGFEVWTLSEDSWRAWMACQTQWSATGAGLAGLTYLGLDYAGVDVVLRRLRFDDAVFDDLMIMETEALDVFAKVRN
ncbi:uncharacterized protein DUF1799 [Rhizobium sp. PP-CC-2G-626]|nr:uncharacterized protein DUF1799 [Rhizobium sp. PP-CC-2G-626]